MSDAYKKAGVDIDAGERLVKAIGPLAKATARAGADSALGGFGGLFDLKAAGFQDPILVSGTDGVGTKLKLAFLLDKHDTIGVDLVAMCVNDVLAQGAEPLFFLDYFATGKLDEGTATSVVAGIADGCLQAGCALVGGETAEMPGMYGAGEYDLAGFCVGAVERTDVMPRPVSSGDVMIGLASSGPHANGHSLIRKIVEDSRADLQAAAPFDSSVKLGEALLEPTRIYVKQVLPLLKQSTVRAFSHITGGGLTDNVPRVLGENHAPVFDDSALTMPPLFQWLQEAGNVSDADMHRTFNCGIGGVIVCEKNSADAIITALNNTGTPAHLIGEIKEK
ncbi:MAG: phosphoribosylformylglycinamidine cyclo-ligase [Hyphococcus sp.]|nr:MAG: phosphoribosylformylglycinamidine cyclo-ligase [Marinicaulis sp.]